MNVACQTTGGLEEVMAKRKPSRLELDKAAALAARTAVGSGKENSDGYEPDAEPLASASSTGHPQPDQVRSCARLRLAICNESNVVIEVCNPRTPSQFTSNEALLERDVPKVLCCGTNVVSIVYCAR